MGFEDVNKQVQWEAKRVAAAFTENEQVPELEFDDDFSDERYVEFKLSREAASVSWCFDQGQMQFKYLSIGKWRNEHDYSGLRRQVTKGWAYHANREYDGSMARGLYRLGFEDEGVLSQLPPLSAHEKLELRLSLPREFWPKRWLEEER